MTNKHTTIQTLSTVWEQWAASYPEYAILSAFPNLKRQSDEFWYSGERDMQEIWEDLKQLHALPGQDAALDFGCGIGRVTKPLCTMFDLVQACDVSSTMLQQCHKHCADDNVWMYHVVGPDLAGIADQSMDFVLSLITLQHIPSELSLSFIREFLRILKPGGIAVFNVATEPKYPLAIVQLIRSGKHILAQLRMAQKQPQFQMYATPKHAVDETISQGQGKILACFEDRLSPLFHGKRYFVQKLQIAQSDVD